jgi:hypothetical protein
MRFVQHIQVIILLENLSQNKAEEENEKKTKALQKISCFVDSNCRNLLDQFSFDKS